MNVASSTQFIVENSLLLGIGVLAILAVTVGFGLAVYLINWGIRDLKLQLQIDKDMRQDVGKIGYDNYYIPQYGDDLEVSAYRRGAQLNRRDGIDLS